uniref:Thymus, brain and testes associated n=1 Tax=Mus musculus TaxID=10090 RepID=D6RH51_MOUSE
MTTEVNQLSEHPLVSPKAEPQPETKPENLPRSHGDVGLQKETVVPGIVDFELIHEELKTTKPQTSQPTPSAYRFGRLSHHSFFSRHHPQPQRVTHIQAPSSSWGPAHGSHSLCRYRWEACLRGQGRVLSVGLDSAHILIPLSDGDAHHLCPHWGSTVQSEPPAFYF